MRKLYNLLTAALLAFALLPQSAAADDDIISFADNQVKALCIANWDTNGDGQLSKSEAAAVTDLGTVFYQNQNIKSFNELQYFTGLSSIGQSAFQYCSNLKEVTLPTSVTSIAQIAFQNCNALKKVVLPENLVEIGRAAFNLCYPLTEINIPDKVTTIGYGAFNGCGLTSVSIGKSVKVIGEIAFSGCNEPKKLIWNAVAYDGQHNTTPRWNDGFSGTGLHSITELVIGDEVEKLCNEFCQDQAIEQLVIPRAVSQIGEGAFSGCSVLKSITVEQGNPNYDSRENCNAIIESATNTLIVGCKNTVIPNSVTSIGSAVFYGYSGLTSIDIPNSVTSIGESAFRNCTGLTSINIPNSVTTIGESAFEGCI